MPQIVGSTSDLSAALAPDLQFTGNTAEALR